VRRIGSMASGKDSVITAKRRFRFEVVSSKGQRITYNYLGESAEQVEKMIRENLQNPQSVKFKGIVYTYQAYDDEESNE
jgi:hypothetical protein